MRDCICETCLIATNKGDCPVAGERSEALTDARQRYMDDPFLMRAVEAHSRLLGRGSSKWPRVEHIREFFVQARIITVGLATCAMFLPHARVIAGYLAEKEIIAHTVCCKTGGLRLTDLGIGHDIGYDYPLCNPVAQGVLFESMRCESIIMLGLCSPHDMLLAHATPVPCTTLFTKEHISNHAPFSTIDDMIKKRKSS